MGRHSFVESDVVRDNIGRFGNENHPTEIASPAASAPSASQRGMPDSVATSTIKLSSGGSLQLGRRDDGGLSFTGEHGVTSFDEQGAKKLLKSLSLADDMEVGDDEVIVHRERRDGSVYSTLIGMVERTGSDSYQVRLTDDDLDTDELADTPPLHLNGKDLDRIRDADERLDASTRVDTGYGDADVYVTDNNMFGFRHLGDDGKPVEVEFDSKSFAKIARAVTVVYEGFDEMEDFVKRPQSLADDEDSPTVTRLDIPTNVGKVRVERLGEWNGSDFGDRLKITPVDGDDWGIFVAGPQQGDWEDALSNAIEYGEALGFLKRM